MAIRYDKKLNQEINRTIKNFNQKIARLEKEDRELLPSKISKKDLKESVYSRKELRRKLAELQRFSKRGAEEVMETKTGIRMTKYEFSELKRETTRVRRMVSRGITNYEQSFPKVLGKKQAMTFAQMGDSDYLNLVARRKALAKDINALTKEGLEDFKKLVEKTGKNKEYMDNLFKNNYIKMLTDLGYYTGYDSNKLQILKDKIIKLKPNKFLKLFRNESAIKSILDYYPMVSGTIDKFDPKYIVEDVTNLYDSLIDNIDDILRDYA